MMTFEALALQCAPAIALDLLTAIVSVESGFDPLAVIASAQRAQVQTVGEAVAGVVGLTDLGRPVGVGLAGIDHGRLGSVGLSIVDALDPCKNTGAAEKLLRQGFEAAEQRGASPKWAERAAIRSWWRFDGRYASDEAYGRR